MFTGLVEDLGGVQELRSEGSGKRLILETPALAPELVLGESVAVNGACLTVVAASERECQFQVSPETLRRTNLGTLRPCDRVNLERALKLGDRLGGHLVQGHIDGLGRIRERRRDGEWELVWFDSPADLTVQMVTKGSIAVDGVSLTLVDVTAAGFSVALIPHTMLKTTLGFKGPGSSVNLETDLLAKYVAKQLAGSGLRMETLRQAGYIH